VAKSAIILLFFPLLWSLAGADEYFLLQILLHFGKDNEEKKCIIGLCITLKHSILNVFHRNFLTVNPNKYWIPHDIYCMTPHDCKMCRIKALFKYVLVKTINKSAKNILTFSRDRSRIVILLHVGTPTHMFTNNNVYRFKLKHFLKSLNL
jgi:hypothetical protein